MTSNVYNFNPLTLQAWADILQMANIKVVSASSCQAPATSTSSFLWDIRGDQICARGKDKESSRNCFRDSCQVSHSLKKPGMINQTQGDSGGSLISSNFGRRCVFQNQNPSPDGLLSQVPHWHCILWGDLLWWVKQP